MKRCILTLILLTSLLPLISPNKQSVKIFGMTVKGEDKKPLSKEEILFNLISEVESNKDSLSVNKKENAVGIIQIRPIMLKEVNQLASKNYTLNDRFSKKKSFEMFKIFMDKFNPNYEVEKGARLWNGGRNGLKKNSTLVYLSKILKIKNNNQLKLLSIN